MHETATEELNEADSDSYEADISYANENESAADEVMESNGDPDPEDEEAAAEGEISDCYLLLLDRYKITRY